MDHTLATLSLKKLSEFLYRYYKQKVIILLDEYDTPVQEAYLNGYWDELVAFTRSLFSSTFKSNPFLERAIMTGITRISKESVFSDLNNLEVITATSKKYANSFGFTESEVFSALDEYQMSEQKEAVKFWYDGFSFGRCRDIYNPWSIIKFLGNGQFDTYWANTSSNSLISRLIRQGDPSVKSDFEQLLSGKTIKTELDEQIIFNQLDHNPTAIWSLLIASGYLSVRHMRTLMPDIRTWIQEYELELTNFEVYNMFRRLVSDWFAPCNSSYNDFIRALLSGHVKEMNHYMNRIALNTFSFFDSGTHPSSHEPERFYHGFVLGLIVELSGRYQITSNRESGYGRYDVMLEPLKQTNPAIILEFKVYDPSDEATLEETADNALKQIHAMQYDTMLTEKGISKDRIKSYGFAFCGKQVLICE